MPREIIDLATRQKDAEAGTCSREGKNGVAGRSKAMG